MTRSIRFWFGEDTMARADKIAQVYALRDAVLTFKLWEVYTSTLCKETSCNDTV